MAYGEYQFETSPRKLQPEYEPKKKKQVKRNVTKNVETQQNAKKQAKRKVKTEVKMIVWILLGFAIFCVISYRNSLINESFNDKEKLKQDLAVIQKENEQLQVSIENSLNLSNIEQAAKDKLGMQKLNNSQKIYVSLPKKDYIEAATEEIIFTEELSWLEQLLGYMKKIF